MKKKTITKTKLMKWATSNNNLLFNIRCFNGRDGFSFTNSHIFFFHLSKSNAWKKNHNNWTLVEKENEMCDEWYKIIIIKKHTFTKRKYYKPKLFFHSLYKNKFTSE